MPVSILDTLVWPTKNAERELRFDSELLRIVLGPLRAIDAAAPVKTVGTTVPERTYPAGSVLVPVYCNDVYGDAQESIQVVATAELPYAQINRDPTAALCALPDPATCDLVGSYVYDAAAGQIAITVSTSHGPWSARKYGQSTYQAGMSTFDVVPGESSTIQIRDAQNCVSVIAYTIGGGSGGGGNTDPEIDTFPLDDGSTWSVYYQAGPPRVISAQNDQNPDNHSAVSEAVRGRAPGALIAWFCEGTTRVNLRAQLSYPYAYVEAIASSASCGFVAVEPLVLESVEPERAGADGKGSVVLDTAGGTAPLTVSIPALTQAPLQLNANGAISLADVPAGSYVAQVADSGDPVQRLSVPFVVLPYLPPVVGCFDEEALNYDPLVTQPDNALCVYAPQWRSLWPSLEVPVVLPTDSALPPFVRLDLYAGRPVGHPEEGSRPLAFVTSLRATVAPRTGVATVDVAPYLRTLLGALQSDGSRRLDLNSLEAFGSDLYTYFRLKLGDRTMQSGYVLNAAPLDFTPHLAGVPLTPFGLRIPAWPGFSEPMALLITSENGRFGYVVGTEDWSNEDADVLPVFMPCPQNPVPVRWLSPEGGYGHWVFSGRPIVGDTIGEGQTYQEAGTAETRYSDAGQARRTLQLSTGVFGGRNLVEGLRTLRRAVQVWYQPEVGGAWVPVTLPRGSWPAYRVGQPRYEFSVTMTEAAPQYVQGQ